MGSNKNTKIKPTKIQNVYIFDIDDTICNTEEVFVALANALSFLDSSYLDSIGDRSYLHFSDCGLITEDEEEKLLKFMNVTHCWEKMNIFNGVCGLLREIVVNGHYIVYLTKRPDFLRCQTEKWIDLHGLPKPVNKDVYDIYNLDQKVVLMTNGKSKLECLERVIKYHSKRNIYYFDNDPQYVLAGCELGIKNVLTFDYGYNREVNFPSNVVVLKNPNENCFSSISKKMNI